MELSLSSIQVGYVIWTLVGVVIGLLLSRLGPSRRRAAVAVAELGQARAEIATRDARIAQLERDVAASRDQVRPLSDEVDRLRRENAKRVTTTVPAAATPGLDTTGAPLTPDVTTERLKPRIGQASICQPLGQSLRLARFALPAALFPMALANREVAGSTVLRRSTAS